MSSPSPGEVTRLLSALHNGDEAARDDLFRRIYGELRELARKVRMGRASETLDTVSLASQAYVKLVGGQPVSWNDRGHFYAVAARAMRQILVDEARRRQADKRGGGRRWSVTLHEGALAEPVRGEDLIALDDALTRLTESDARASQVVELRFYMGMTLEETARFLGVSTATVERDWRAARAWLARELAGDDR